MPPAADSSVTSSDAPALDMRVVAALEELGGQDDPELFDDLVQTFAADSPPRIAAAAEAVRDGDAEGLYRAAHGLKSSAANMGAHLLAETCRRLEDLGREGSLDAAPQLLTALRERFTAALEALRRVQADGPGGGPPG